MNPPSVWFLVDVQAVCANRWTIALHIFTQSTPPSIWFKHTRDFWSKIIPVGDIFLNVSTGRSPYFFFRVPFHGTVILPGVFAFICIFVSACLLVFAGPLGHVISSSGKYWDRLSPFDTRLCVSWRWFWNTLEIFDYYNRKRLHTPYNVFVANCFSICTAEGKTPELFFFRVTPRKYTRER